MIEHFFFRQMNCAAYTIVCLGGFIDDGIVHVYQWHTFGIRSNFNATRNRIVFHLYVASLFSEDCSSFNLLFHVGIVSLSNYCSVHV